MCYTYAVNPWGCGWRGLAENERKMTVATATKHWARERIVPAEVDRYLPADGDFIPDGEIHHLLTLTAEPDAAETRAILAKARAIETLTLPELATLMRVRDPELWAEMRAAAGDIKRKVYDNRIVTFAPLYCSSKCVNNCLYCGLRSSNSAVERRVLRRTTCAPKRKLSPASWDTSGWWWCMASIPNRTSTTWPKPSIRFIPSRFPCAKGGGKSAA